MEQKKKKKIHIFVANWDIPLIWSMINFIDAYLPLYYMKMSQAMGKPQYAEHRSRIEKIVDILFIPYLA